MNAWTSGEKKLYRGIKRGFNIKVYQQHLAVLFRWISHNPAKLKNTCYTVGKSLPVQIYECFASLQLL